MKLLNDIKFKNKIEFEYDGITYNCDRIIKSDREAILREADTRPDIKYYDRESLFPHHIRLFINEEHNVPEVIMIVYGIKTISGDDGYSYFRQACGLYHVITKNWIKDSKVIITPHEYQGSICW